METGRAAADRGGDKKPNMAVDWQTTAGTRQTSGKDNSLMDPTGEAQTHLATTGNTSAVPAQAKTHFEAHKDVRT